MLKITNLVARIGDTEILSGLSLTVNAGEVHAIMGPNGSGKSTLAQVIAGHADYEVTAGSVEFKGHNLLELEPEERARDGIFLGFQYPVEIPGVNNAYLLKAAVNAKREHQGKDEIDAFEFMKLAREKMALLGMDQKFLSRGVNEGFSGVDSPRGISGPNRAMAGAWRGMRHAVGQGWETGEGQDFSGVFVVAYELAQVVGHAPGGFGGRVVAYVHGLYGGQEQFRVGPV